MLRGAESVWFRPVALLEGEELTSRRDLLASSSDTDDDALAPALVARLESSPHDAHVTGAVKGIIAAAVGHLDELVDDGLALGQLGGVDEIGGAELLGPLLLGRVDVHDDDLLGALLDRALHHGQADAAGTEDRDVAALLDVGRDASCAVAGGDAASQQTRAVHGRVRLHRHHRDVGHHGVLAEGRGAHEVQDVLALALEARRAVRHQALALSGPDLAAEVGLAGLAELALAAFGGTARQTRR